ncbi:hypothetical protein [Aestuariivivens sediminicola]|uniref:hypothetical protein n=1 Tax=Aestuariivivens sediminicola TaxID=2913560 RepID=UPI001F56B384|nr:hypothetical protein [Aestuariivivens sediminicola]
MNRFLRPSLFHYAGDLNEQQDHEGISMSYQTMRVTFPVPVSSFIYTNRKTNDRITI